MANVADSLPSSEDKAANYGDFVTSYKTIFNEKCSDKLTQEQRKLISDMITLQDKQVMRIFSDYRNHGDLSRLLLDIKVVIPSNMKEEEQEMGSLIKPNKVPVESNYPTPNGSPQEATPAFDTKNARINSIREEMNLNISTVPAPVLDSPTDAAWPHEDEPSFKEALLTYVLRKEGIHDLFVSKFISRLEACQNNEFGATDSIVEELIDYAKSRLTSILYNDFGLKEISTVLQNPDMFMECFMKTNRVNQDQKGFLKTELKDCLSNLDAEDAVIADEQDDPLVKLINIGMPYRFQ